MHKNEAYIETYKEVIDWSVKIVFAEADKDKKLDRDVIFNWLLQHDHWTYSIPEIPEGNISDSLWEDMIDTARYHSLYKTYALRLHEDGNIYMIPESAINLEFVSRVKFFGGLSQFTVRKEIK